MRMMRLLTQTVHTFPLTAIVALALIVEIAVVAWRA